MTRLLILFFFLIALVTGGQAQWLLYDCSKLPSATGGDELDLTDLSQDDPGPNFVEEIMADPDIPGNFLLRYIQPDEMNVAMDANATKMYRNNLEDGQGGNWGGTQMTMVARLKGLPNWEELDLDRIFDLQYRLSTNDMRDELRIHYDDMLELEKAGAAQASGKNLTDWHIYRIAIDGKTSTVYIDESNEPIVAGDAGEGTSDLYIKIGDGSGDKIGGYVDWVAIDTTGAYSPSEKPLDDRFTGVSTFNPRDYRICFLTFGVDDNNNLDEQPMIDHLRERGFHVDYTYNDPNDIIVPADIDFTYEKMNDYDLVIIGRSISSGDFQNDPDVMGWASVETPVMMFSGYIMRNSRLKLINSGSVVRETGDGATVDPARVTNVEIVDGPLFTGLDGDGDGEIGYQTWFYEYVDYGSDTFEMNHNGTLHASLSVDGAAGDGSVYVASWPAGVEGYDGAGVIHKGTRMYFHTGSDDSNTPKLENFFPLTEESTLLYHNAIKWLLGADPDGVLIEPEALGKIAFITKDVDENNNLEEIEIISDLRSRGYTVDVSYPNPDAITVPPDFDFTYEAMNDYDVVIIGRGVGSGDFQQPDAVEGWESVESPVIIFSAYLMRNSRLKIANSGSAARENDDGPSVPMDRITYANIVDHPVFTGVDTDMDDRIAYLTWFYDFLGYGADTFEVNHNATLLAALDSDGGPGDGTVYMAHWAAGMETYPGSGVTPMGDRLYMQMGSDDNNSPKVRNYTAFTDESLTVLYNALDWLSGRPPAGVLPDAGPIAHWNFDAGSGTVVEDMISNADGEILNGNGITWESCGIKNSLNFAGSTKLEAVISIPDNPSLNFNNDDSYSISMLVKCDPFSNIAEMNFFLKGDNGTALPDGMGKWYSVVTKDMQLRTAVDDNVVKTQLDVDITQDMFPPNEWNHVVAVRDRAEDSLKLYLNGELVGSIKDDTDGDISTDRLPAVIGNYHSDVRRMNGSFDEIAVYGYALDADQVAEMYASLDPTSDCAVLETISELSDDATLSSLSVDPGALDPAFDPEVISYKVELPEGSTSCTITAVANHPAATIMGDGVFSDVPGTAVVTVTAEDGSTRDYSINISVAGVANQRIPVEPGFGTIEAAILEANDGDTLVLQNGEFYNQLDPYIINKKLVIIAEEIASLPGLDNLPIIENLFLVSPVFNLQSGANLHLIGIEVDGQGATNIINAQGTSGESRTVAAYINRCRLHNTTDDVFNDARDGNTDNTQLTSCIVRNTFIYNTGSGHGLYIKNYAGSQADYIFENITYWNIGEQFNWIRHYAEGDQQTFIYDHMTGYNMSTDVGDNKELFGNSDGATEAVMNIQLKNSIFHTQASTNEGSLKFDNRSERHSITINNNVLFNVQPIFDLGGTIQKSANQEGTDPSFADPDNGDFTVGNSDLYTAADDGKIIGAVYWHPEFVDDFSDLTTSAIDILKARFDLNTFPNPFDTEVTLTFNLENQARVVLNIYDLNGNLVRGVTDEDFIPGFHTITVNTGNLQPGVYFYQLRSNGAIVSSKMIKAQ